MTDRLVHALDRLRSRRSVVGYETPRTTLAARMKLLHAPAVSVAVLEAGTVEAFAVGSTPDSLFQAASISKPVTAMAVCRLAESGLVDLDAEANDLLRRWKVPDGDGVTVRRLLCHAAGLTVHGFPGYERDAEVPDAVRVLDGGGNTEPVRVERPPGEAFQYSGGGYTVLQVLVEDVTGRSFADAMSELVLDRAGMTSSTFEQPLPDDRQGQEVAAHDLDGVEVRGRWHVYPEQAAAGLWTTPRDLLAAAREMIEPGSVVTPTMRDEMLRPQIDAGRGLGWMLDGEWFTHSGGNAGFRCLMYASVQQQRGTVVMTNGDGGGQFITEATAAIAEAYGWEGFLSELTAVPFSEAELAHLPGTYEVFPGFDLRVDRDGDLLVGSAPGYPPGPLYGERAGRLFSPSTGLAFEVSGDEIRIIVSDANSLVARRKPPEPAVGS